MATVDLTTHLTSKTIGANAVQLLSKTLDFAATSRGAADVLQVFPIKAGQFVAKVWAEVETVEGGTLTFDIGDGADPDGYVDGANGNSAGYTANALTLTEGAPNTVTGYSNGKLYTADDTIDFIPVDAADTAKITVKAIVFAF